MSLVFALLCGLPSLTGLSSLLLVPFHQLFTFSLFPDKANWRVICWFLGCTFGDLSRDEGCFRVLHILFLSVDPACLE